MPEVAAMAAEASTITRAMKAAQEEGPGSIDPIVGEHPEAGYAKFDSLVIFKVSRPV